MITSPSGPSAIADIRKPSPASAQQNQAHTHTQSVRLFFRITKENMISPWRLLSFAICDAALAISKSMKNEQRNHLMDIKAKIHQAADNCERMKQNTNKQKNSIFE